ncbi:hypothetical protein HGRIS_014970 [Hohenbuehelia grisea]|uniref:Uncharacterized protein n=1 Tax=Hohenbuehelia grisea TaxID=104357 RepID=A0ABR3IP21_9AGAR
MPWQSNLRVWLPILSFLGRMYSNFAFDGNMRFRSMLLKLGRRSQIHEHDEVFRLQKTLRHRLRKFLTFVKERNRKALRESTACSSRSEFNLDGDNVAMFVRKWLREMVLVICNKQNVEHRLAKNTLQRNTSTPVRKHTSECTPRDMPDDLTTRDKVDPA